MKYEIDIIQVQSKFISQLYLIKKPITLKLSLEKNTVNAEKPRK